MTTPLEAAVGALERGGLVVYPTDTLWGLGARATDARAVERVFEAKRRPRDQPLSIAVGDAAEIPTVAVVTPLAQRLFSLLPGSLTLVLERRATLPDVVTGGTSSVGVRVPAHPVALELLRAVGPLTATSANVHEAPDPKTLEEARRQLGDRVNYYLASSMTPRGVASTVVDARGTFPRILRPGAVGEAAIRKCLGE